MKKYGRIWIKYGWNMGGMWVKYRWSMVDIWKEYLGRDIGKNGKFGITNMKKSVSRAFATRAKNTT